MTQFLGTNTVKKTLHPPFWVFVFVFVFFFLLLFLELTPKDPSQHLILSFSATLLMLKSEKALDNNIIP